MSAEGTIFDVREFCLHDGPGIRTTVFFKGCPLRCAWCHNPEGLSSEPQLWVNHASCTDCGACRKACPLGGSAQPRPPPCGKACALGGSAQPRPPPGGTGRKVEGEAVLSRRQSDSGARILAPSAMASGAGSEGGVSIASETGAAFCPAACSACGACVAVCPQGCRRVCGRRVTAEALAAELCASSGFFKAYGGGITFSGGEPLAQTDFLVELAERLRPVHLTLETSGYAPLKTYQRAIQAADLVFQDLKHPDPVVHMRVTGAALAPILENLAWLKASGRPFIARIPLIPGVNDATETLAGFADLLSGPSGLTGVELLPYHLTAGAKYPFFGMRYALADLSGRPLKPDLSAFASRGLPCRVM